MYVCARARGAAVCLCVKDGKDENKDCIICTQLQQHRIAIASLSSSLSLSLLDLLPFCVCLIMIVRGTRDKFVLMCNM